MMQMRFFLYILLLFGSGLFAQGISPQVINSSGSHRTMSNGASMADNVGEPFTETFGPVNNAMITQGFLQPVVISVPSLMVTVFKNDVTCADKDDGRISTAVTTELPPGYKLTYIWTPTINCPAQNCTTIDSLRAGSYSLTVIANYTTVGGQAKTMTVSISPASASITSVADLNGPCKVKIFNGVSIDGGNNGHLHIENIEEFPNNRITIYNRWGAQLYDEKGYDNTSRFWPAQEDLGKLQPSTYFYVLDLGDGSKPIKGWVELVKR